MNDRHQKAFLVIGGVVALLLLLGVYTETKKCEAKGGKRLRGALLEGFKCYDASALKVLP